MLFWNISSKREFTSLPLNKGSYPVWNAKYVSPWKKSFIVIFSWVSLKKKKFSIILREKLGNTKLFLINPRLFFFFSNVLLYLSFGRDASVHYSLPWGLGLRCFYPIIQTVQIRSEVHLSWASTLPRGLSLNDQSAFSSQRVWPFRSRGCFEFTQSNFGDK